MLVFRAGGSNPVQVQVLSPALKEGSEELTSSKHFGRSPASQRGAAVAF